MASLFAAGGGSDPIKIEEINLDDNGLKDESFAMLLDPCRNNSKLQSVSYGNN